MTPDSPSVDTKRSSVSTKIFLIVAIFSLPIGVLAYLLAANYTPQIEVAQLELSGDSLQKPLMQTLSGLASAENALQGCEASTCAVDLAKQNAVVSASLDAAGSLNTQLAADLKTSADDLLKKNHKDLALERLQSEWKSLAASSSNISTPKERLELAANYENFAGKIKEFVNYMGDTSNLILDPDLDSYYVVDVTLLAMPEAITRISNTASLANQLVIGTGSAVEHAELLNESALFQQCLTRIAASNDTSYDADAANHGTSPTLQPRLKAAYQQYLAAGNAYLATLKSVAANPSQVTAAAVANQAAATQQASLNYFNAAATELDILLNMRIAEFQTNRIQALGFSALAVVIATIVAFLIGRSITRPLQELVRNLAPGATLLGVSVERIAEASHSQTPSQEESQIICEELNAHAENMRKAVLELARHVEGSAAASRLANQDAGQARS